MDLKKKSAQIKNLLSVTAILSSPWGSGKRDPKKGGKGREERSKAKTMKRDHHDRATLACEQK